MNLSTYEDIYLEGLAVGYRITKYAKYFFGTNFGCYLMFPYDADLADGYYMEYYNNTNKSMPLCTPIIPMRLDTFRKWVRTNSLLQCRYYQVGWLKEIYQQGDLSYIWNISGGVPLRIALIAAAFITIIGVLGVYC